MRGSDGSKAELQPAQQGLFVLGRDGARGLASAGEGRLRVFENAFYIPVQIPIQCQAPGCGTLCRTRGRVKRKSSRIERKLAEADGQLKCAPAGTVETEGPANIGYFRPISFLPC